jgi:hypothetical protein
MTACNGGLRWQIWPYQDGYDLKNPNLPSQTTIASCHIPARNLSIEDTLRQRNPRGFAASFGEVQFAGGSQFNDAIQEGMYWQKGDENDFFPSNYSSYLGNDDQVFWPSASEIHEGSPLLSGKFSSPAVIAANPQNT